MKMKSILELVVFCPVRIVNSKSECPQGWIKWQDLKCYSLHSNFLSYEAAQQFCAAKKSHLATIKDKSQQTFLNNFIHNVSGIQDEVWLGATRVNKTDFRWEDGTPLDYTNWAPYSPSKVAGRDCVVMQSRISKLENPEGRWRDVSCTRPNYFVCEMEPSWGLDDMQKVLLETRKKLENLSQQQESRYQDLLAKHERLAKNPVPIGYVYTQLPGHHVPSYLWPNVKWSEISLHFAGKFFRVVGGTAGAFGTTQNASSPRLSHVRQDRTDGEFQDTVEIIPGSWSKPLAAGGYDDYYNVYTSFLVSNPETRPVNTAVRIWIRES